MAVVYFTSNASTGAGSLSEAVQNAQPGDVVRPDETVFERGSTIEIVLASPFIFNKNLTLDAEPFRVRLNGSASRRCALVSPDVNVEIQGVEFVSGKADDAGGGVSVSRRASAVFRRCVFAGCQGSAGGGLYCSSETEVQLYECVATGCCATSGNGGGVASSGRLIVSGSTIYGNVASGVGADLRSANETVVVNSLIGFVSANLGDAPGDVVGVASSAVGFVAPPPDDLTPETWEANAWQNWDLRLLDDASGAPSPYRDSGDVGEMSQYDLQGNFRGRETNGVATCSPGAYETIQADLFWVGEPFPQTLIDLAPQNLVVSDFTETSEARASATVSWTTPEKANYSAINWEYKTDGYPTEFTAIAPLNGKLTSRKATIVIGRIYTIRIRGQLADGSYTAWSVVEFPADASLNDENGGDQTTWTTLPSPLNVVAPSFRQSDGWAASRFATVSGDTTPQSRQTLFVDGAVAFVDATPQNATLNVGGRATVSTGINASTQIETSLGLASTLALGTSATLRQFGDVARLDWNAGDLTVACDVAQSTLTVPFGATLAINGGKVRVATLTLADGANVAFSGADAVLTATETATVGAATFSGVGYFATPQGTDLTAATFAEDVRACDYGAGISAFSAVATSPTEAAIEWSATDETATLCVERKTSSGWEVVDVRGESGLTAAIATPGATVFRAFDGAAFWSDSAWFLTGEQFTVETDFFAVAEDGAESVEYETETHIVTTNIDKSIYWGQSLTFLARIRNAFTGELLLNDGTRTKGVRYSLYRREGSLFSTSEDDVPVRLDVDAGAACLLETAQTSDAWPGVEYNFALIPANSADDPLIPAPGNYVLRVFVELTTGNPIVFVYTFAAR